MVKVYDKGLVYDPQALALSNDDIVGILQKTASRVAAVSMEVGLANECSAPHMIAGCFKKMVGLSFMTG